LIVSLVVFLAADLADGLKLGVLALVVSLIIVSLTGVLEA